MTVAGEKRGRGRPSRRAEMVAAAERLIQERGLGGVTTRAIAERVPCSEGALYVHFEDRLALVMAVLEESLPAMLIPLHALREKAGQARVEANLGSAFLGLVDFHRRTMMLVTSLLGEPELRERFRRWLGGEGRGPERGIATLARYIEAEKELGRIAAEVDAEVVARGLMAQSFFHVFTEELFGRSNGLDVQRIVAVALSPGLGATATGG